MLARRERPFRANSGHCSTTWDKLASIEAV
jgi:hypothetical protein